MKVYKIEDGMLDLDFKGGDFVRIEDYAELQHRLDALAVENAMLKSGIADITFMRDDDFFASTQEAQRVMGFLVNIKTPATDAYLNSVRAEGVDIFNKHFNCEDISDEILHFADRLRSGTHETADKAG